MSTDEAADVRGRTHAAVWAIRIAAWAIVIAMTAGIVWATAQADVVEGLLYLAADRWGLVTLMDVYAGAVVVAVWMRTCERKTWVWLIWVIALIGLGHAISALYMAIRSLRARTLDEVILPRGRRH